MKKVLLLMLVALLLAAVPVFSAGSREAAPPSEITLGLLARGISDALRPFIDEYQQETGVRINLEQFSADGLHDRMMLEMAARSGYFDVIYLSPAWIGALIDNDYIIPVDEYMEKFEFDLDDFLASAIDMVKYMDREEHWGLPYLADTAIMFYRQDLFYDPQEQQSFRAEYGYDLRVPETTDELLDIAEFFTRDTTGDGQIDLYGFGYPQQGVTYGYNWILPWVWTFGAEVYDNDLNVTLNDPKTIEAVTWAKKLQQFQPPGVLNWEYAEHEAMMTQGGLAMSAGWYQFAMDMNDPAKSDQAGNIGYAPVPRAPGSGLDSGKWILGGGAVAIPRDSRNHEAAFQFLNWVFGDPERSLQWYLNGGGLTRQSVLEAPEIRERYPFAEELFEVAIYSLENVAKMRPTVPVAFDVFVELAAMWHAVALDDKTPERAVADASAAIDQILARIR